MIGMMARVRVNLTVTAVSSVADPKPHMLSQVEAAAVTEVAMLEATAYIEPEEVYDLYFNQPFFYMILDTKNQIPVFMGIIDQP